jgi:hypothetical protein
MNKLSNSLVYHKEHEARVLNKVLLLKNWFASFNEKEIGDPDLFHLVVKLMQEENVPYSNKDVFFTQHHAQKIKPNPIINQEEQKIFNKDIEAFLKKYELSWEYYLAYRKDI